MIRRLLRLPAAEPPLPAGNPDSATIYKPDTGYLKYRLLLFATASVPSLLFAIGIIVLMLFGLFAAAEDGEIPALMVGVGAPFLVLVLLRVVVGAIFGVVKILLQMEMLRYILTDEAVRLRRGVIEIEEITLSFSNIQNVKLRQGFVQRIFGIADLVVETAGGGVHEVGGHVGRILGVSDPAALREMILERARAFKGSGLGGPVRASPRAGQGSALATTQAAALLREVVSDLREIRLKTP